MAEAKNIVKNKFWVLEENGHQIGTIQAVLDGVMLVKGQNREKFSSLKILANKHNIKFTKNSNITNKENVIYGFPCDSKPYNSVYEVKSKLPLFTKDKKSKSYHCAGYYLVNIEGTWINVFCPKKIILQRHKYLGPFKNKKHPADIILS